ncbi:sulfotransferase family protein [Parvibaculum sp.]|uniref:sulfotransferase family protein n=1 Tax=Parvibaculum sp. TaxID=2024848 RepID=UPI002FD8CD25
MIVGAMKAGTSTLHATLAQHPEIFMTKPKELHAWDMPTPPPVDSYHMHFERGRGFAIRGESTPSYAYHPGTMERLARYNPGLKLIFIMRDPVKRAISHINHSVRLRRLPEKDLFGELLADQRDMSRLDVKPFRQSPYGYHARGLYHLQISRMRRFFDATQIHMLRLEDFTEAPQEELDRICDFLGATRQSLEVTSKGVKKYDPAPPELISYLSTCYRLPNRILAEDFGVKTDDWL